METGIQSSFIPKEATQQTAVRRPTTASGGMPDLFSLLGTILLVASLALAGGVFLYHGYLQSESDRKAADLKRVREQFDPVFIRQATRLHERIRVADGLLKEHLAPSVFFGSLNETTLATISYGTLALDASDPTHLELKVDGVARSVNSIAYQASLLKRDSVVHDAIFSGINRQPEGVRFTLDALIDGAAIGYAKLITGVDSAMEQVPVPAPVGTSTPSEAPPTSVITPSAPPVSQPSTTQPPAGPITP